MASKDPRSNHDHEARSRRPKAVEASKEPKRPRVHWDHVLEEMAWLSKDFESERRWKLAQARKVAAKASKGVLDQATRGDKRVKEEELRLRKIALNISKDVKKFWTKIEKLVLYKHQLELDKKKKKALDKQLEFLLGQTERYSSMLAENLVPSEIPTKSSTHCEQLSIDDKQCEETETKTSELITGSQLNGHAADEDFDLPSSSESEDDERTLEEDEALITKEEREEELAALQNEVDLPIEELLKRYAAQQVGKRHEEIDNVVETTRFKESNGEHIDTSSPTAVDNGISTVEPCRRSVESNGALNVTNHYSDAKIKKMVNSEAKLVVSEKNHFLHEYSDEQEDDDFELSSAEEKEGLDDESTILEEEQLSKADLDNSEDEISLLQKDSEVPIEELLAKYKKVCNGDVEDCSESLVSYGSEDSSVSLMSEHPEINQLGDESNGIQQDASSCLEEYVIYVGKQVDGTPQGESIITDAAVAARSAQPTGNTFSTTKVKTKFPFLLKYPLREYQHIGLDWLVTMYEKRLNGILADEMGLGKTIMTISLLAHLACEKGIWGPHLIVVPTSVMLNWETEFLKWCPAFKILTYFGSAKERRLKRQGWLKPNSFHVCITTYRLVIQDAKVFKRKKWKYLILDEAHLIKNWKSQRWQTLLNFNSKRRILLTGTPLQNDLMELWSLMHFLMPHVFQSHQEFKDWFCNPISGMVEGQEKVNKDVVDRLHNVLRPFILRRLKRDVEKQLPLKHEHVIYCRLSRRQRNLYEDFIASSETQATLASANFFGMIGVIMQLRKVCNHPDLFEGRPIISSFDMEGIELQLSSCVCSIRTPRPFSTVDLRGLGLVFTNLDFTMASWESEETQAIATPSVLIEQRVGMVPKEGNLLVYANKKAPTNIFEEIQKALFHERMKEAQERAAAISWWNSLRCKRKPLYSTGLRELVKLKHPVHDVYLQKDNPLSYDYSSKLTDAVLSPVERFNKMSDEIESFMFANPAARAPSPACWCSKRESPVYFGQSHKDRFFQSFSNLLTPFRSAIVRRQVYFPDRRLIQFDCGKLQELAVLLRRLKFEGHRALIFTQMTKMLDILESFISLYGYTYMRLDGSTPPEKRQTLMQQFNTNPKIFLFILSTRSGGVGINLVGADTVIFYDSDWNPAMDQQAQDRCHRIGQTREVHIYRLISESTIEENILKKANQKRALDDLVIQSGGYNTEFFTKLDPMELFSGHRIIPQKSKPTDRSPDDGKKTVSSVDLEAALKNAEDEADYMALKKVEEEEAVDNQEFTEEAIGKMDDDELLNDEEMKHSIPAKNSALIERPDIAIVGNGNYQIEEENAIAHVEEDDVDMLADVKQMATAAAESGQAILSFENQLRPIDQYAVRFLELWDPLVDKTAVECNTSIEEAEWELERLERLKDEMEAEIDEDEEPLVYESWNSDFATEAYKQQVEILTQHQLKEDLEREAREKEALESANLDSAWDSAYVTPKPKLKKKAKKAKFKSLKKGSLVSKSSYVKEESSIEPMSMDDESIDDEMVNSSETLSPCSMRERKRPASDDDEQRISKKSKKLRTSGPGQTAIYSRHSGKNQDEWKVYDDGIADLGSKHIKNKSQGGRLSIPMLPPKRVFTIKTEKPKKKGMDLSSSDIWSPTEDALLCALVHKYGPNWSLASDFMYGMTAGGSYRGRFHHPVHCCERFRDMSQRFVLSAGDATSDKAVNTSGKTLIRVNEVNVRTLLEIASGIPDSEPLLQTHFFAALSATWRARQHSNRRGKIPYPKNGYHDNKKLGFIPSHDTSSEKSPGKLEFTNLHQCGKLVAAALNAQDSTPPKTGISGETSICKERLDVVLELQGERDDALPPVVNVTILVPDPVPSPETPASHEIRCLKSTGVQFRDASSMVNPATTCLFGEDSEGVAQPQHSSKHRLPDYSSWKPSRSRPRRSSKDHSDQLSMLTTQADTTVSFNEPPSKEAGLYDIHDNYLLTMEGWKVPLWSPLDTTPLQFAPDDLSTVFTDID